MLVETKARVGVFSIALGAYLPQFPLPMGRRGDASALQPLNSPVRYSASAAGAHSR